jgi:hypothetical protein
MKALDENDPSLPVRIGKEAVTVHQFESISTLAELI